MRHKTKLISKIPPLSTPPACECGCIWTVSPYDTDPCPDCHAERPSADGAAEPEAA